MKVSFVKTLVSVSVLTIGFSAFSVHGQSGVCSARVLVNLGKSNTAVTNVRATAVKEVTGKSYRSVINDDFPYFRSLPEGDYKITVAKAGFKTTSMKRYHDCSGFEDSVYRWSAEMYKGNPKVIFELGAEPVYNAEAVVTVTNSDGPKTLSGGVLNAKATSLPQPAYPAAARAVKASGAVSVEVLVGLEGNVVSASAVSGHPLLRAAAESAAREAKFSPTLLSGQPVKISGIIVYNFVP